MDDAYVAPVSVDKSGQIHSEGKIVFDADAAQNIPDYIKIVND